jgi:transcription elongation factor Elf1
VPIQTTQQRDVPIQTTQQRKGMTMQCPRCHGAPLIERGIVTREADERELYCVVCSRSFRRELTEVIYRPLPDVSLGPF